MSSKNEPSKRNYRGRGKKAMQERHSSHTDDRPILKTSQMRPIRADAVSAANAGRMPLVVDENDPFAPQTTTASFAATMENREVMQAQEAEAKISGAHAAVSAAHDEVQADSVAVDAAAADAAGADAAGAASVAAQGESADASPEQGAERLPSQDEAVEDAMGADAAQPRAEGVAVAAEVEEAAAVDSAESEALASVFASSEGLPESAASEASAPDATTPETSTPDSASFEDAALETASHAETSAAVAGPAAASAATAVDQAAGASAAALASGTGTSADVDALTGTSVNANATATAAAVVSSEVPIGAPAATGESALPWADLSSNTDAADAQQRSAGPDVADLRAAIPAVLTSEQEPDAHPAPHAVDAGARVEAHATGSASQAGAISNASAAQSSTSHEGSAPGAAASARKGTGYAALAAAQAQDEAQDAVAVDATGNGAAGSASAVQADIPANTVEPAEDAPDITLLDLASVQRGPGDPTRAPIIPDIPVITGDEPDTSDTPTSSDAASASAAAGASAPGAHAQGGEEYSRDSGRYTHRKRFSGKQRVALVIVAVIAVVLCGIGGAAFAVWQNAQQNIALKDDSITEALSSAPVHGDPYWVLVLGSDKRPKEDASTPTRSDVIMLVRIDEVSKQVTLVSLPRDTKVELQGYGSQKINAAFALGGAKLALNTVSDYAGVDISHYVEVYFDGFEDLVDQLGGVDVDVPEFASYKGVSIEPGLQHLNGKEALTLARVRKTYVTGDFRRTECQRLLVAAIAQKVLSQDALQLPGTINALTQCFATDMPLNDVLGLALTMRGTSTDTFYSVMAPSTTGMLNGVSYTFTYIDQWKLIMQRANKGVDPTIDDTEAAICGYASTQTDVLDMSVGLSEDIQAQLKDYEEQKAKEAAEKETKAQKKASKKKSKSGEEQSGDSGEETQEAESAETSDGQ